jgi:uncharacterized protein YcbK (DUF882 family)
MAHYRRKVGAAIVLNIAISLGEACGAFLSVGGSAFGRTTPPTRSLSLDNVHTGEALRATYWEGGRYLPDALAEINRILRDYRTNEIMAINTRLLDLLHRLRTVVESDRSYQVISGYRSASTNAALLQEGHHVAEASFHTVGMAIDIRLPGRSTAGVRRAALELRRGGVGYPDLGFVHVDVGPVRHW